MAVRLVRISETLKVASFQRASIKIDLGKVTLERDSAEHTICAHEEWCPAGRQSRFERLVANERC